MTNKQTIHERWCTLPAEHEGPCAWGNGVAPVPDVVVIRDSAGAPVYAIETTATVPQAENRHITDVRFRAKHWDREYKHFFSLSGPELDAILDALDHVAPPRMTERPADDEKRRVVEDMLRYRLLPDAVKDYLTGYLAALEG